MLLQLIWKLRGLTAKKDTRAQLGRVSLLCFDKTISAWLFTQQHKAFSHYQITE